MDSTFRYTECIHLIYTSSDKYANAVKSYKKNEKVKKVYTYLGKVVDKDQGIYNRKEINLVSFDFEKENS